MRPIFKRELNGGTQEVYRFDNQYGASVIRGGRYAYGGLELAVLKFNGTGDDFSLCYSTPITSDVLGHLDESSLKRHLLDIQNLDEKYNG